MVTALVFGGALIVGVMILMGVFSSASSRPRRGTVRNSDGSVAYMGGDGGDACDSSSDAGCSDGGGGGDGGGGD